MMFSSVGRIANATASPPTPRPAMIGVMPDAELGRGVYENQQGAGKAQDPKAEPDERGIQAPGARGEPPHHGVAGTRGHRGDEPREQNVADGVDGDGRHDARALA
jgi:hypothetical protein